MPELYGRRIQVDVANLVISAPRIALEMSRDIDPTQNKGQVDIYNLNPERETFIVDRGVAITVSAGYPETLAIVFEGQVQRVVRIRKDLARIVRITLGDAAHNTVRDTAMKYGTVNRSYPGPVAVSQIAKDMITMDMGLIAGPSVDNLIPAGAMFTNFYWTLGAREGLTHLLGTVGRTWFEDDGVIRINGPTLMQSDARPVTVTPETGLIGTPAVTDEGWRIQTFLNPIFKLGGPIALTSETVNGDYKIVAINHTADNWQGRFTTSLELRDGAATPG